MNITLKKDFKISIYFLVTVILTLGLSISLESVLAAWTSPTSDPPTGNVNEPINTGSANQAKTGGLGLGGNFGITTVGSAIIAINADTDNVNENDQPQLQFYQDGGTVTGYIGYSGGTNHLRVANFWDNADADIDFVTRGSTRMTVDGDGRVGIGTTNPGQQLTITGCLRFDNAGTSNYDVDFCNDDAAFGGEGVTIRALTNPAPGESIFRVLSSGGSERLRVEHDGLLYTANDLSAADIITRGVTNCGTGLTTDASGKIICGGVVGIGGGGTANYVPKWTGAATLGNSSIYIDSANGNVGIGTISPSGTLNVNGSARIGIIQDINNSAAGEGDRLYLSGGGDWVNWNSENSDPIYLARYNSNNDDSQLRINLGDSSDVDDKIEMGTTISGAWTPRMTVVTNGNVGIGTTNPDASLHIAGAGGANDPKILVDSGGYYGAKNGAGTEIRLMGIATNDAYLGAIDDAGGRVFIREDGNNIITLDGSDVGIGTISPGARLEVEKNFTDDAGAYGMITDISNTATYSANRTLYGHYIDLDSNIIENGFNAVAYGLLSSVDNDTNNTGNYNANNLEGVRGMARNLGNGTVVDNARGLVGIAESNRGTVSEAIGLYGLARTYANGGIMANAYGVYGLVSESTGGGAITTGRALYADCNDADTCYGLYIAAGDAEVLANQDWGIYVTGEDKNLFSGSTILGSRTLTADEQGDVLLFSNSAGTAAQGGAFYNKLKLYGGGGQTRDLQLWQQYNEYVHLGTSWVSNRLYVDSSFSQFNVNSAAANFSGIVTAEGGLIIDTRTSDPASPVDGQIWLRTDL